MKKKLLHLLPIATTMAFLPVVAASGCGKTDEVKKPVDKEKEALAKYETQLNVYKNAYKAYNGLLSTKAKELKTVVKKINDEKDKTEKEKLQNARKEFVDKHSAEILKLRQTANEEYKKLRDIQKDSSKQLIKIFHTNDEHGRIIFDDGKYNCYSGMQSIANAYKGYDQDLFLSAGDLIQGLPLSDSNHGLTIAKIAESIGYDATAVGNHEFDFGLENIFNIDKETPNMPFLSANAVYNKQAVQDKVKNSEGQEVKQNDYVFKPYIIKTLATGVKVGILGITTPDTKFTSHPRNSVYVDFMDPVTAADKVTEELKKQGINIIVAITHLGVDRPQNEWDSRTFAEKAKDIDIVLDGHSHTLVKLEKAKSGKNIYLAQTEAYTKYLSELDVIFDVKTGEIVEVSQQLRDINQIELLKGRDNTIAANVAELIKSLQEEFDQKMKVVEFTSPIAFKHIDSFDSNVGVGKPNPPVWTGRANQTNLGLFASDAIAYKFVEAKVAGHGDQFNFDNTIGLYNGGGLRGDLEAKEITRGDMYAISPFGNRITAVKVKGSVLLETMKHGAAKTLTGAFAQYSSNVTATINAKMEGEKKVYVLDEASVKINGKAINPDGTYFIVTNDFIVAGGDGYAMLNYTKSPEKATQVYEDADLLEVLIEYAKYTTANEFKPSTTNDFGKLKMSEYTEAYAKKVIVHHKAS